VIIYKFTQGNLGAKKIASKEKKWQIATLVTDSAIPANKQYSNGQEGSTLFKSCIDLFFLNFVVFVF
jgi:hypothetical protein